MGAIRLLQIFQLLRHSSVLFYAVLLPFLGFTSLVIGWFEQGQFLCYALSFFWLSGMIQGLMYHASNLHLAERKAFLVHAYWVLFLFSGLSILCFLSISSIDFQLTSGDRSSVNTLLCFLIFTFLQSPAQLLEYGLLLTHQEKRLRFFAYGSYPLQMLFFAIPLLFTHSLILAILGLTLWALLRNLIFLSFFGIRNQHLSTKVLPWLRYSFPLVIYALVGGGAALVHATIVHNHYQGDSSVFAVWRYGYREIPFVNGLLEGLTTGIVPLLVNQLNTGLFKLRRNMYFLMHSIFPLAILLVFFAPFWFPRLFSEQFYESAALFRLTGLLLIFRVLPTNAVLNALGHAKRLAFIGFVELLLSSMLAWILVPIIGLPGIPLAALIGLAWDKGAGLFWLWRQHGIGLKDIIPWQWWVFYIFLLGAAFLSGGYALPSGA